MVRLPTPSAFAVAAADVVTLARAGILAPTHLAHAVAGAREVAQYGPLAGSVALAARRRPNAVAVTDDAGTLTFAEVQERSEALARAWAADGLGAGDRVAVLCRNHRAIVDATLAATRLGVTTLYLNTGFGAPQIADVVERERVAAIVYDAEFAPVLGETLVGRRGYLGWAEESDAPVAPTVDGLIARAPAADPGPPPEPGGIVMLTSGTTGAPKGAPRRQPRSLNALAAMLSKVPFRAGERTMVAAPAFHATGFAHLVMALGMGSGVVLHRRFDARRCIAAVADERCTALIVVPIMLQRIVDLGEEELRRYDLSSLRIIFCAGSALSGTLASRAMDAFGDVLYNLYGSTEVAQATIATPSDLRAAPGTAGRPPRGTTVRLFDDAGRRIDAPGVTGRIFVGNVMQFEGYTDGQTKEVRDGLMATGDVGHFDAHGRLFVDGRDDEMIVSGAENVYPAEVEELLAAHPSVAEVAVVGVPDDEWGQRLRAYVVPARGAEPDVDVLCEHVRANLARHKVPRDVVFLDELPRNPTGKVLKRELASS